MMLLHFTIQQRTQHESSTMLREQILDLSKRYIKALAEENRNVVDGPYVGTMTAYGKDKKSACFVSTSERMDDIRILRLRLMADFTRARGFQFICWLLEAKQIMDLIVPSG
ncbi:unnamed protein product [Staurois parvus]|uniref:MGT5A-like N-terminal domain-containing protein n=1 Tax=Staurois parvus TaxID=386267 RepID=A0ABN9D242_9NEOB|nr:unnamed protein product [Staurois parvus]